MEMSDVERAEQWLERARELDGLANNLANLMSAVEALIVVVKEQAETISRLEAVVKEQAETISRLEHLEHAGVSSTHGTASIALRTLTLASNGRPTSVTRPVVVVDQAGETSKAG